MLARDGIVALRRAKRRNMERFVMKCISILSVKVNLIMKLLAYSISSTNVLCCYLFVWPRPRYHIVCPNVLNQS